MLNLFLAALFVLFASHLVSWAFPLRNTVLAQVLSPLTLAPVIKPPVVWIGTAEATLATVQGAETIAITVSVFGSSPILLLTLHDEFGRRVDLLDEGQCVVGEKGVTCQYFQPTALRPPLYLATSTGRQARTETLTCFAVAGPPPTTKCTFPAPPALQK